MLSLDCLKFVLVKVVSPSSAAIFCELFDGWLAFTDFCVSMAVSSETLFGLLKLLAVSLIKTLLAIVVVVLVLAVVVLAVVVFCSRGPVKRAHCSDVLSDGRHKLKNTRHSTK